MQRLILLAALLLGCGISVSAQNYPNNYETTCAQGFVPVSGPTGSTYNQATGKYRAVMCSDPFGNVTFSGLSGGINGTSPSLPFGTDTGSVNNAYIVNPSPAVTLTTGATFNWTTTRPSTGAATINVSGTGVQPLSAFNGANLTATGEIGAGIIYTSAWNGTEWLTNIAAGLAPTLQRNASTVNLVGPILLQGSVPDNGTGFMEPNLTLTTPFNTTGAVNYQRLLVFSCAGSAGGCGASGQSQSFGYDGDGVFVINGGQMAFLQKVESFGHWDFLENDGNVSSVLMNIQPGVTKTSGNMLEYRTAGAIVLNAIDGPTGAPTADSVAGGTGVAAGLAGTGACATITTQRGGAWAGSFVCTGTTGASTVTVTIGATAPNGWVCVGNDITAGLSLAQSASTTTTCTLKATVTQNDVLNFSAVKI